MIQGQLVKRRLFTLGADPEMFVFSGHKLLPAFHFLPGKREGAGPKMYWDGFQAEWKYDHDGSHCLNNLVKYTRESLVALQCAARKHDETARISLVNVVRVPQKTLDTAHPLHIELGCQPSYNAYNLKGKTVLDPRKLPYRFAGGHMHFGSWPVKPNYDRIIQTLDSVLGVWAVGVARHLDTPIRRQYYGLAGEYRKPQYVQGFGVEYRVLSNFWLASPALLQVTWDIGRMCVRLSSSGYRRLWAGEQKETIETINNCDVKQADKIMKRNKPMFEWILKQCYKSPKAIDTAVQLSQTGLESLVKDPENFSKNWHFGDEWYPNGQQPWARFETSL